MTSDAAAQPPEGPTLPRPADVLAVAMNLLFSEAAHRFFILSGRATQFAAVAAGGIRAGAAIAGTDIRESMRATFGDIPEYEPLLAASNEWWSEILKTTPADVAAAAVLVLKHGALDDLLISLCRITGTMAFQAIAERKLGSTNITIAEALDEDKKAAALSDRVQKFINDLARSSLMQKIAFLYEFANPKPGDPDIFGKFKYDPDRLTDIDKRRHDAVHQGKVGGLSTHQEADSQYLFEVGMLMLFRFQRATGLTLSEKPPGMK